MRVVVRCCLIAAFTSVGSATLADTERPNVVFILADDLGYGDVNCFGQDRCQIETPHFDRLAAEGIRYTNAHVNCSWCIPTRMAIMTGRYPWRFAAPEAGGPWGFLGTRFPENQHTLGRMMHQAGYRTGYIGKWHLGTQMTTTDGRTQGARNVDYTQPLKIGPRNFEFDDSFILPGSLDMFPYAFIRNNEWVGSITATKGWSAFNRQGPSAEDFEDTKVLDTLSTEAERFIATSAGQDKPFFLFFALTSPHTPISPSREFEGRSKIGVYGDFVMETDHCVGRILNALDKHGIADNTLVIASSDHGPAAYAGRRRKATVGQMKELEAEGHFAGGQYRGYKFSVYEGGLRVACVARWPKAAPAGTSCNELVALQDLMVTLADITDTSLADNEAPDSFSFLPLLLDPTGQATRPDMVLESSSAMAITDGRWKLALCPGSGCPGRFGNEPKSDDAWKAAIEKAGKPASRLQLAQAPYVQLFNLETDPEEAHNLAERHPERVTQLVALLKQRINSGRSTPGPKIANDAKNIRMFRAPGFVFK